MLSSEELRKIQRQLENNPTRNTKRKLKKKIKEHEYAVTYPKFTPFPHHRYFINRLTEEKTLVELIKVVKISTIFLLDTESVLVYRQQNRPGLIQLQIIPPDTSPIVLIVEINHLPSTNSSSFQLIKQLFRIVLDSNNVIYTWGTTNELYDFNQFELFNDQQIEMVDNRDLQNIFQRYWRTSHRHQPTQDCTCEECIGKNPNEKWSLQDAVAFQLKEWLDKRQTCSSFDMGLDPKLKETDQNELEFLRILTDYAANDCLAMEKLMISIQENPPQSIDQLFMDNHNETTNKIDEMIRSDINTNMLNQPMNFNPPSTNFVHQSIQNHQFEKQQRMESKLNLEDDGQERQERTQLEHHNNDEQNNDRKKNDIQDIEWNDKTILDETTKTKKRKNRLATLRQRRRHFKHEIKLRGIDPRFSITIVKEILRRYEISHTAVNIAKSSLTNRTSLYIGIKYRSRLREYHDRIKSLFTTDYYNEFQARHHLRRQHSYRIR